MDKRKRITSILLPVLLGSIALQSAMSHPRMSQVHTVDILPLIGCGMCFGVALASLFDLLNRRSNV